MDSNVWRASASSPSSQKSPRTVTGAASTSSTPRPRRFRRRGGGNPQLARRHHLVYASKVRCRDNSCCEGSRHRPKRASLSQCVQAYSRPDPSSSTPSSTSRRADADAAQLIFPPTDRQRAVWPPPDGPKESVGPLIDMVLAHVARRSSRPARSACSPPLWGRPLPRPLLTCRIRSRRQAAKGQTCRAPAGSSNFSHLKVLAFRA